MSCLTFRTVPAEGTRPPTPFGRCEGPPGPGEAGGVEPPLTESRGDDIGDSAGEEAGGVSGNDEPGNAGDGSGVIVAGVPGALAGALAGIEDVGDPPSPF